LLKHPSLDQLHALGLHGMAKAFAEIAAGGEADGLGHHEWLGLLLDREASWRQDKRLAARLRVAKLRQQACVEDVDYRNPRGLDRALFQKLVEGEWINAHDNLALIGPTECDSYCSSLDLLKDPTLSDADCQTTDAEVGGPELLG
jgi:IstB-like ATP binding protein